MYRLADHIESLRVQLNQLTIEIQLVEEHFQAAKVAASGAIRRLDETERETELNQNRIDKILQRLQEVDPTPNKWDR